MVTRNASLQAQLDHLTQQLSQLSQCEIELAVAEKTLTKRCQVLEEKVSTLSESRDEACQRADSLATELANYQAQL